MILVGGVHCAACEVTHPQASTLFDAPVIECANAPDDGTYRLVDTAYLFNGGERVLTGYDGPLWIRYPRG